jgi:lysophospholipase L1-like esterase
MRTFKFNYVLTCFLAGLSGMAQAASEGAYDFDGDNKADIAVFHRAAGDWYIENSSNNSLTLQNWGWSAVVPVPGDYDGDNKVDIAVFHRSSGTWYILQSSNGQLRIENWGWTEVVPVQADYDGDNKTDLAVYRRKTGTWSILQSATGTLRTENWGWSESRPVPADYDGDNKADVAVYHAAGGNWYILQSQSGTLRLASWGWSETVPVPCDYDGDNKADVAVYNPQAGDWYILQSLTGSLRLENWGWSSARPVPADYDGDNKDDIAVYHPQAGDWYILKSGTGQLRQTNWGWDAARACASYALGATENVRCHSHGDSITFGRGSSSDGPLTGYPILLERKLEGSFGGDFASFNYGDPGERTSEGLDRIALDLAVTNPDVLFLMEGTNDHGADVPFSTIENNLRSMISTAKARGIFVVLATIPPVISNEFRNRDAQASRIRSFNPTIYDIGADMDVPIAPVHEYITAVPGWQDLLIEQESANHPNDAGYRFVRDAFLDALAPYLNNGTIY